MKRCAIAGWGLYPQAEATIERARFPNDLPSIIRQRQPLLPQGNCRSYGDSQ